MTPNLSTPQGRYKARAAGYVVPLRPPGSVPRLIATGTIFSRLTVVRMLDVRQNRHTVYECRCECGATVNVTRGVLLTKNTRSCGCLQRELTRARLTTHGMTHTHIFTIWNQMKNRCRDPKATDYHLYGGRGIRVCERWQDFANFFADMGHRPSPDYSIDRIDNNGPYSPENCRWATAQEQASNRRPRTRRH